MPMTFGLPTPGYYSSHKLCETAALSMLVKQPFHTWQSCSHPPAPVIHATAWLSLANKRESLLHASVPA